MLYWEKTDHFADEMCLLIECEARHVYMYSWPLNNTGVRGDNTPRSQKSE